MKWPTRRARRRVQRDLHSQLATAAYLLQSYLDLTKDRTGDVTDELILLGDEDQPYRLPQLALDFIAKVAGLIPGVRVTLTDWDHYAYGTAPKLPGTVREVTFTADRDQVVVVDLDDQAEADRWNARDFAWPSPGGRAVTVLFPWLRPDGSAVVFAPGETIEIAR
jgi:hypothetical protein